MTQPKAELRRAMRRMRATLGPLDLEAAGRAVVDRVLALPEIARGPVLLYVSVRREVPTEPLFRALWEVGVPTAVPCIEGVELVARARRPDTPLVAGAHGIPTTDADEMSVAWALCPGLAFDRSGWRLGYGGGFYDRFLQRYDVLPVALGVDAALVEHVPHDSHDVPMHAIVTPSHTVRPAS